MARANAGSQAYPVGLLLGTARREVGGEQGLWCPYRLDCPYTCQPNLPKSWHRLHFISCSSLAAYALTEPASLLLHLRTFHCSPSRANPSRLGNPWHKVLWTLTGLNTEPLRGGGGGGGRAVSNWFSLWEQSNLGAGRWSLCPPFALRVFSLMDSIIPGAHHGHHQIPASAHPSHPKLS